MEARQPTIGKGRPLRAPPSSRARLGKTWAIVPTGAGADGSVRATGELSALTSGGLCAILVLTVFRVQVQGR